MKNTLLLLLFCIPILGFAQCIPPNGCENGTGTYTYSKDQRYEGEWLNGERHGVGTLYVSKDQRYEGEWLNGKKHGTGAFYYNSIDRNGPKKYVGKWENNKKNGIGSEFYNNGIIWKGSWFEGEKEDGYSNEENYYNPNDIKGGQISSTINLMELMPDHYYISIDFNGLKKDFTFDTGATCLAMSSDLLLDLKKHGVKIRDLKIEGGSAKIASGELVSSKKYVIDNIRIGDYLLNNIVVSVGAKGTSSLCGIGLFNKFSNVEWNKKDATLKLYK